MVRSLRELRTAKPLSIRQLAREAGIAPTTYLHLEAGRRLAQPATMVKISRVLGVEPGEIAEFRRAMEAALEGKEAA